MKRVIYTCLFGDIDYLPTAPTDVASANAICFTDNLDQDAKGWELRSIPNICESDPRRLSRFAKILPHRLLAEYDVSLYLDCNVRIKRDVSDLFELDDLWVVPKHPERECIFLEESKAVLKLQKDYNIMQLMNQLLRYKLDGMPNYFGLTENNFIIRKHNDNNVIEFCEEWWKEYINGSPRDQISFPYVAWKTNFKFRMFERKFCDKYFFKIRHDNHPLPTKIRLMKKIKNILFLLKYYFSQPYRTECIRNNVANPLRGKETVAFIVTFYNQLAFTKKCVESYYNSIDEEHNYILILLDDHSTDESPNYFGELSDFSNCYYLRFIENRGLTRSWNYGVDFAIKELKADYIFLSNNDVILSKSSIPAMMKALKGSARGGFVGPVTNCPGYHAYQDVRRFVAKYEASDCTEDIEHTAAACSDKEVMRWDELNGFLFGGSRKNFESNRFVRLISSFYFNPLNRNLRNEIEFQHRLRKRGTKVYLAANAFVFHYKDVTMNRSDSTGLKRYTAQA